MIVKFKDKEYELEITKYFDGKTALILNRNYDDYIKCSVNIKDTTLLKNEIFIKNYSENKGVFEALISAGVIENTYKNLELNYGTHSVEFPIGRLLIDDKNETLK